MDEYGRTVGFSYRVDNSQGKYINSKTNDIFKKGSILYGLNYAKKEIRQHDFAVLVEGFNDAIALQKFGVPAVAVMGTAVTSEQMALLKKYTSNIILFLDGDTAGIESTVNNIKLLKAEGFEVDVLNIKGFYPDDVAYKHTENTLKFILENKKLAFQFLINNVLDNYFDSMIRLKKETMKNLNDILNYIDNEEERKLYYNQLVRVVSLYDGDEKGEVYNEFSSNSCGENWPR
jgi:DNA primase